MRGDRMGALRGARRLWKQRRDPWKHFRELWVTDAAPAIPVALLRIVARSTGVEIRNWER
jgi:hypothetical protein